MNDEIETLKIEEKETVMNGDGTARVTSEKRYQNNWIAGIMLVAIGAIFLLANVTDFYLQNWWALFILIPAISSIINGVKEYQSNGRYTKDARNSMIWGVILGLISATFLFNLNWAYIWPFFLIFAGVGILWGNWADSQ